MIVQNKKLRQFSLTWVQKNQAPSAIEYTRTFASVFFRAKAKKIKLFAVLQLLKRIESFVLKVQTLNGIDMIV